MIPGIKPCRIALILLPSALVLQACKTQSDSVRRAADRAESVEVLVAELTTLDNNPDSPSEDQERRAVKLSRDLRVFAVSDPRTVSEVILTSIVSGRECRHSDVLLLNILTGVQERTWVISQTHDVGALLSVCAAAKRARTAFPTRPQWALNYRLAVAEFFQIALSQIAEDVGPIPVMPTLRDPDPTVALDTFFESVEKVLRAIEAGETRTR